ncbi:MAG: hypothetical protein WBK67_02465 [Minisyncoccales bacterium]
MGWYDSFRGNVAGVNMSGVGSDAGLGAKAFGDAFVTIGKSMTDATKDAALLKTQEAALRADEAKVKSEEAKTALYGTQNTAALDAIETTKADKETKKLDDAFSTSYRGIEGAENIKLFKDNYPTGNGYGTLSSKAVQEADAYFQSKFNDEAKNKAVSGGYKDFATFAKENEQLVKMADGTTMAQLDKHFGDKDMSEAKMAAQEAKTQNAIAMLEIKREMNNINAEKNKAEIENKKPKFNDDYKKVLDNIGSDKGKWNPLTDQYDIPQEKIDEVAFAKEYSRALLLAGETDLAKISKLTDDAYAQKLENERKKSNPLGEIVTSTTDTKPTVPKASTIDANAFWGFAK